MADTPHTAAETTLDLFKKEFFTSLDETFNRVHGIFLDKGTSLFETLDTVTAEEASRAVAPGAATIAAQVDHLRFYLDVVREAMANEQVTKTDWGEIWRTVKAVSPDEWTAIRQRLRESYERMLEMLKSYDRWEGEYGISSALGILAHTAYHLGGIRQALARHR
ncbi:MAG TPA: DinB family protein [Vicinamibacterales bacterium]|jgi:hypothetical protein|nr:DinB family protein [Vicinamibacterales bacterium]